MKAIFQGPQLPVAWTVEIGGMTCVVFAATKAKAQWLAVKFFWDAGFGRPRQWPRPVAYRAETYDRSSKRFTKSQAWSEEHIRETI